MRNEAAKTALIFRVESFHIEGESKLPRNATGLPHQKAKVNISGACAGLGNSED